MTSCRRIQRGSLAVVALVAALAGMVAARPGVTPTPAHVLDRAVVTTAHVAAGLGHTGHHVIAGLRHAIAGTTVATIAPAAAAPVALLLIVMTFGVARIPVAQRPRSTAIRAPPGR